MPQILTRRSLVAAAPAAIVAASLPALAGNDDEHLLALGLELAAADELVAVADRRLGEVSAAYDRIAPDRPEVFALPDDDLGLKSRPEMSKGKPTGRFYYGPKEIEAAEIALLVTRERDFPLPDSPEARRKMARLQEIVDRHREDQKARRAAWIATGMEEGRARRRGRPRSLPGAEIADRAMPRDDDGRRAAQGARRGRVLRRQAR